MDTLGLLLPFLRNLEALRLLIPTGTCTSPDETCPKPPKQCKDTNGIDIGARALAEFVEQDDEVLIEKLSEALADQQLFQRLKVLGFGRKAFLLGEYYTVPADQSQPREGVQSQTPAESRAPSMDDKSPQSYGESEQGNNNVGLGVGLLSPGPNQTQTNSPKLPSFQQKSSQPTPVLGKRMRDEESALVRDWPGGVEDCLLGGPRNRTLRRRVQRVGWDVIKQWEIWGKDTQEL